MKSNIKTKGFTLLELMITISIVIILSAIGIPGFVGLIRDSQMTTNANDLLTSLNYARSEAITRNVNVAIKRKSATASRWHEGWDIFTDFNGNGTCDDGCDATNPGEDELLKTHSALPSSLTLETGGAFTTVVVFKSSGLSKGGAGDTFKLCNNGDTTTAKRIILNNVGRAKVEGGNAC